MADKHILDKNFVPKTPSAILTAEHGNVKVVTTLYGPVTPERLAAEQQATNYRADQLDPPKRRERPERPVRATVSDRIMDDIPDLFTRRAS